MPATAITRRVAHFLFSRQLHLPQPFSSLAHNLFDEMPHRAQPLSAAALASSLKSFSASNPLDETLALVKNLKSRNCPVDGSVAAALIVDALCRVRNIEDAWTALTELRLVGWKPDFISYRIVSEGFALAGRFEEQRMILKQKRKFGVAPRVSDYEEFLHALVSERRFLEAKELGEAIVLGDFPIGDHLLDLLIGSVSDVDVDSALLLLKHVVEKDRILNLPLLKHVCGNVAKNGKGDEMWNVFKTLTCKGYFGNLEGYRLVVYFLCEVGKLREAYDVLKEMKRKSLGPDVESYNHLMEACCRHDFLRPAKKLWDEMFASGCPANLRTYNALISKLSEEGQIEEAQNLFNNMISKGIVPDRITYDTLIKYLCQEKMFDEAVVIFNKSVNQDLLLAQSTLRTLLLRLCKEGNYVAASTVLHNLSSEVEGSDAHVILLKSLTDASQANMAINHISWISKNCNFKLQTILTKLLASLSTSLDLRPVRHLLRLMIAHGFISKDDPWMELL